MHRLFNLVSASVGLLVLSPLFAVIALLVKSHDGGTVFFRPRRIGKDGEPFLLFKFRTMVPDADKKGPGITSRDDARVTPVGAFLRRTKMDELPQLVNVVLGDMNLVGPRPEDPRYVEMYTPEQRGVLAFRPGMTSPASLYFSNEEELLKGKDLHKVYVEEILPIKLSLELKYFPHQTIAKDFALIISTIQGIAGKQ